MSKTENLMTVKDNGTIVIREARLSYVNLKEPRGFGEAGTNPKFSVQVMLDKEAHGASVDELRGKCDELIKAKGPKFAVAKDKWFIKDGDESGKEEYAGHFVLSTSATRKPVLVDRDRTPIADDDERPYSGCYANVIVRPWVQDNQYGKRMNCSIEGVQFIRDGERFGGNSAPSQDDFDEMEPDPFGDES